MDFLKKGEHQQSPLKPLNCHHLQCSSKNSKFYTSQNNEYKLNEFKKDFLKTENNSLGSHSLVLSQQIYLQDYFFQHHDNSASLWYI